MLTILLILNFVISWFNAWSCGRSWVETKAVGGFPHFVNWCGAIMSASGFTWVYVTVVALIASHFHYLPEKYVEGLISLAYLIIILPVLGSGLGITLQSWAVFWKNRTFGNGAVTGWNTFAQIHNMYEAASAIPEAFTNVAGMFGSSSDDDEDNGLAGFVVLVVIAAALGGILTTCVILRNAARSVAQGYALERRHGLAREGRENL